MKRLKAKYCASCSYHQNIRYLLHTELLSFTINCFTELLKNLVQGSLGLLHMVC